MNFFRKLLQPNSDTSSRRLIALLQLPLLYFGTITLIRSGVPSLQAIGVAIPFLIVMIAFFALDWKDAKDILGIFSKVKRIESKEETTTVTSEKTIEDVPTEPTE